MNEETQTVAVSARVSRLELIGTLSCLLLSLTGASLSEYLTVLKFRISYTPCLAIGEMSCEDALASPWSNLLGLPISLWGTAFYILTALLAMAILWRPRSFGGVLPNLLLTCTMWAALVTVALGGYTLVALSSPCEFCLLLYVISMLMLVSALFACGRSAVRPRNTLASESGQRLLRLGDAGFYAALAFIVLVGTHSMVYHGLRRVVDLQDGCPEPMRALPFATIRSGSAEPRVIIVMFVDMTSQVSRSEFERLGDALLAGKFPTPVQLWIYHRPRQICDLPAFPAGKDKSDNMARDDNACLAARAAECMEKLRPGSGFSYIGELFALQEAREPNVPLFTADRVVSRAVDFELGVDPDDIDNALFRCIADDPTVRARITEHQKYAESLEVPTLAVYRARDGQPDLTDEPVWIPSGTPLHRLFGYVATKAGVDTAGKPDAS